MRAVRVREGQVEVTEVQRCDGPGVRVKVSSAGICGSDLHLVGSGLASDTITLGHEIAGFTDDGTPVAVEPLSPCGRCDPCCRGEYNLCADGSAMLFGVGRDGGMADAMWVPERALVRLPAGVDPRDASMVEPLAVLVHSFRRAQVRSDQRVAVVGGGAIGLCAVAVARAHGCEVGLAARHDAQRVAGERLGATEISGEYDLVIEAAGSQSALEQAVKIAKPSAQVAIPGIYWGPVALPGMSMCLKQVTLCPTTLYGRHAAGRDVDNAAALLASSPGLAETIITHRFPLDAAPEAFAVAADRASGAIKVVLEP
ncbi:MAG: alcohol dehydrogenase catalytic domain-containing protein [Actinomycetia bacterium]|nr:alcohol dehydrogenase catalytic domain-containing protein [Actinomycetes bacterium]MCP4958780.1 alcohol dehydrogenase catalytic domain-containing protein [Actinomycetes bacterium]